jgi:hypothetical protein
MHVGDDPVDGERIPVSAARISPAASTSSSRGAASQLTPPPLPGVFHPLVKHHHQGRVNVLK